MTTGATAQLGLALPVQGELSGTWGDTVNNGITQYTNIAIAGTLTLTGDGAVTLANTTGDASASNITSTLAGAGTVTAQFAVVRVSGTTTTKVVTGPSYSKTYLVDNASSFAVTFKASGQTGVSVAAAEKVSVYFNGTDYVKIAGTIANAAGSNTQIQFNNGGLFGASANLTWDGTTLSSTQVNITGQGTLRLQDTTGGEYVGLRSPSALGASYTLTFPADDGTSGQALITDGSGVLSWSTAASGDVYGPASSTDNAVARFDSTTGKLLQNSVVLIGDTGAVTGVTDLTASGSVTLSGGTANGVAYLNGSKVVTSGSALVFDGTALGVSGTANNALSVTSTATTTALKLDNTNANGWGSNLAIFTGGSAAGYFGTIGSLLGSTAQDLAIYATSSKGVRIYTNDNNERMRVTSAGDVGIGTSSPSRKLQVIGTAAVSSDFYGGYANPDANIIASSNVANGGAGYSQFLFGNTSSDSRGYLSYTHASDSILFGTAGTTKATLDSSGNLGLGVTPSAWASGTKAFQLQGGSLWSYSTAIVDIIQNGYFNGTNNIYSSTAAASFYRQTAGAHTWYTAPSGTAGNAITFTQAMTLDASGNLLVGSTSVNSGVAGIQVGSGKQIAFDNGNANLISNLDVPVIYGSGSGGTFGFNGHLVLQPRGSAAGAIILATGSGAGAMAERARIDSSGNLIQSAPTTPPSLATNGTMVFNLTSNTNLRVSVRGSDGVTRTANITLA